mgnify:CR=1 FL=1
MQTNTNKTFVNDIKKHSALWGAFLFLLIAGAKIDLDFGGNVSFTLQTLVLGLAYYFLPRNWRLTLILTYLLLGIFGFSVYNGGSGWSYFVSWPLGFFVGFILAAFLKIPKQNSYWLLLGYFLLLHAIIVVLGSTWLAFYANSAYKGLETALELLPGAIIKSGVGTGIILIISSNSRLKT